MDQGSETIRFDPEASLPKQGVALVYDLEGFSRFFNQPDVNNYVPKFLNKVNEALGTVIFGGEAYWTPDKTTLSPLATPVHEKFLGDGALILWTHDSSATSNPEDLAVVLCNRLWNLKTCFSEVLKRCADDVPVVDLPSRIRFGLAAGSIFELHRAGGEQREYIGFCINLASRLQKYCPHLGFIASARLGLPAAMLAEHGYIKVVAKKIKGFPREIVLMDESEYLDLDRSLKSSLFDSIENTSKQRISARNRKRVVRRVGVTPV